MNICFFQKYLRRKKIVSKQLEVIKVYEDYEPIFLIDHLKFGTQFRKFLADSIEVLIKDKKPAEHDRQFKMCVLQLFKEEINAYEDLGALLLAMRSKIMNDTPILKTFFEYSSSKAIISKLVAECDLEKFIEDFYLKDLLCPEYVPLRYHDKLEAVQGKIAEIIVDLFGRNSSPERYDAFLRTKHGPLVFDCGSTYTLGQGNARSNDMPGMLIRTSKLDQKQKNLLLTGSKKNMPIMSFCIPNTREEVSKKSLNIDISMRFQQLLVICFLQKYHQVYLEKERIDQDALFNLGQDIDMLLEQLPNAFVK